MSPTVATPETLALRERLAAHRDELDQLLRKYNATNPRLFGSVARGDAGTGSDIDIMVDMDAVDGNLLLRAAGLMEESRNLLGPNVDIFPVALLKHQVSAAALADAVSL